MPTSVRVLTVSVFAVVVAVLVLVFVADPAGTEDQATAGSDASSDSRQILDPADAAKPAGSKNVDATRILEATDAELNLPDLFAASKASGGHGVFQVESVTLSAPSTSVASSDSDQSITIDIDLENDRLY